MDRLPGFPETSAKYLEKGQALLIVLLAMSVVVTVVLSVVSRSVTEVAVTSYEENALRAFSAAEAGIEQVLLSEGQTGATGTFTSGASFVATPSTPGGFTEFDYPIEISSGQSATFWFVSHGTSGNLTCYGKPCLRANQLEVCWGELNTPRDENYTPAIELSVFYDDSFGQQAVTNGIYSSVKVARAAYDPNLSRSLLNKFKHTTKTCSFSYDYKFTTESIFLPDMNIPCSNNSGCLLMAKVRMFYNDPSTDPAASLHPVSIRVWPRGGTSLPGQGLEISSTGTAGESTRRISVFQGFPESPVLIDAAVFSLNDLTK